MIVLLEEKITSIEAAELIKKLDWMGIRATLVENGDRQSLAIVAGVDKSIDFKQFEQLPGVEAILPCKQPYKLASSTVKKGRTVIALKGKTIGAKELAVMAGPCSIESEEQIIPREVGGNEVD